MWESILISAGAVFFYMTAVFGLALLRKDNSLADIAWGPGFVVVAFLNFFRQEDHGMRQVLVTGLVLIWGARLAIHIYLRNRGKGEDSRYARWRREWGKWFALRSFFQVFMLQGVLLLVISYSVLLVNHAGTGPLASLDFAGLGVWLIGFVFEAIGDWQLRQFKAKPENKGRIMTAGLWKFTRHPNYFGEASMWWGIFLIALSGPEGWTAVVSPLAITFLLLRVSGVAMIEKKYVGHAEFEAYARRTSAFFPWFPKKD